ncbi:5-formyltetrahydrofolate cyclo-ligase [Marinobacterium weihaiense]|uniref:5-formyltetrahydrofolate cyclo-ligase n=1 Tax=Marinobacterium weihaiense TaxID=2851016 RepID=A0ABS6MCF0_9GAMM|nr:5-formyltetrahydrofolate cyclo-ligase [Marinobacterium weihaiense]MBV0933982.1 5-formyltetrahydrofolate cyclo-ligase [Marinobacterium weihaiense]
MMQDRKTLRRQMRARRRALSPQQQRQSARSLCRQLSQHLWFRQARHIALYLPNDGEIDTAPLIHLCRRLGKQLYLPVLHPIRHNRLWFTPYHRHTPMRRNRYRILEPVLQGKPVRPAFALDLVLMPLVAFSADGGRMGMGGGYYDRSFAFKLQAKGLGGPRLMGLAHDFQRQTQLPLEPWDVPLDAIATERGIYRIR